MEDTKVMNVEEVVTEEGTSEENEVVEVASVHVCSKCGEVILNNQKFCPNCGKKYNDNVVNGIMKNKKNKILIGGGIVLVVIAAMFLFKGTPVKSIELEMSSGSLEVGSVGSLSYVIYPENAKNQTVKWSSSDESVATVDEEGLIYGVSEGSCKITAETSNGKMDICVMNIVAAKPDLRSIFDECCASSFAYVASDGSYLTIDTNPDDKDDYTDYAAYLALYSVQEALGLPDSLMEKMGSTRALDGMQSATYDDLEITWTYHPDNGLEVIYSLN